MEDTSLEDFVGADARTADGEATQRDDSEHGGPTEKESSAVSSEEEAFGYAATAAWTPAGAACAKCGEVVEWQWQGPDGLVCPDCKEW